MRRGAARPPARGTAPTFPGVAELEAVDRDVFRGGTGGVPVHLGQIAVQAQLAAGRTVGSGHPLHSVQAQFPRPPCEEHSVVYLVDRVRDGATSVTRRVTGVQAGEVVCAMHLSYQRGWRGGHQLRAPRVPPPEALERWRTNPRELGDLLVDLRLAAGPGPAAGAGSTAGPGSMAGPGTAAGGPAGRGARSGGNGPGRPIAWVRLVEGLPDDQRLHAGALTYIAGHAAAALANWPPPAARAPVGGEPSRAAALDHAAWFHRPFRADEWLLLVQDSPSGAGPRTFTRATFFDRDGLLVASTAQELALG